MHLIFLLSLTDEAVEQFIEGSIRLRSLLLSRLHSPTVDDAPLPCALLEKLFPAEFSLTGSLGMPSSPTTTPFVADEVQIRYLIKVTVPALFLHLLTTNK